MISVLVLQRYGAKKKRRHVKSYTSRFVGIIKTTCFWERESIKTCKHAHNVGKKGKDYVDIAKSKKQLWLYDN